MFDMVGESKIAKCHHEEATSLGEIGRMLVKSDRDMRFDASDSICLHMERRNSGGIEMLVNHGTALGRLDTLWSSARRSAGWTRSRGSRGVRWAGRALEGGAALDGHGRWWVEAWARSGMRWRWWVAFGEGEARTALCVQNARWRVARSRRALGVAVRQDNTHLQGVDTTLIP